MSEAWQGCLWCPLRTTGAHGAFWRRLVVLALPFVVDDIVVEDLLTRYVHCIDDGRYEEWPGFFDDPCIYHVISAENYERGLPSEMALISLFDPETGMPKAIVDGTMITEARTGR